jgi:antitoxin component YwqK of YwqJK toxin-antitoxin module
MKHRITYHNNGQKCEEGYYKDGKKDGLVTEWLESPINWDVYKRFEGTFKNGERSGLCTWFNEWGRKELEKIYKDGELISKKEWKVWNEDGSVKE